MEFKIYNDPEEKNVIYFKLKRAKNRIRLIAVNNEGVEMIRGVILSIDEKGLHLHEDIDANKIDLPLDREGCIKIAK